MGRPVRLSTVKWAAGTAASPSAAASYQVHNVAMGGIERAEVIGQDELIGFGPRLSGTIGRRDGVFQFSKWLNRQTASGSVYSPATIGALLRACGFAETVSGDGYIYTFATNMQAYSGSNTTGFDAIDLTWNKGVVQDSNNYGMQEILKDALGNVSGIFRPGQRADFTFDWFGRINTSSAADSTHGMMTDTAQTAMGAEGEAGTTTNASATFAGVSSLPIMEFSFAVDNGVDVREDINGDIGGYSAPIKQDAQLTASILIESQLLATLSPRDLYIARTNCAVSITHDAGAGVGNEVVISGTFAVNGMPTEEVIGRRFFTRIPLIQKVAIPASLTGAFKLTYDPS